MKDFLDKDFLLSNETAKTLYFDYAEKTPIYDYHCHLNCKEIYDDKKFSSITEAWLGGDHYKWRLLRAYGIEEKYITGDATDYEKFEKYAEVIPYTIGNPVYHWTHLELRRFFNINETLSPKTAKSVYEKANKALETLSARKLIKLSNVVKLCTTDDPIDDLKYHKLLREDESFETEVNPTFRPDKALNIELATFVPYVKSLEEVVGYEITSATTLKKALIERVDYFDKNGCALADHSLEVVMYENSTDEEADEIFKKAIKGEALTKSEVEKFKGNLLVALGREYSDRKWVLQLHIGAMRNNSTRNFKLLGADTGFDSINDGLVAEKLSAIMNALDMTNQLPKTILYCLNPRDNEVLATLANCFQGGGICGKIQFGSGWWFNDQKDGMQRQMEALAQLGLLSKFVGMLTDSRSFLSYARHEYFRRILCNKLGTLIENGEYPCDIPFVGKIVQDICYYNAEKYLQK